MLSKKHFKAIAQILSSYYEIIGVAPSESDALAGKFCEYFKSENERFDEARFILAIYNKEGGNGK